MDQCRNLPISFIFVNYYASNSVVTCPPVPDHSEASPNTTKAVFGTYVKYTCSTGKWFLGNLLEKVIMCNDSGIWNDSVPACASKISKLY